MVRTCGEIEVNYRNHHLAEWRRGEDIKMKANKAAIGLCKGMDRLMYVWRESEDLVACRKRASSAVPTDWIVYWNQGSRQTSGIEAIYSLDMRAWPLVRHFHKMYRNQIVIMRMFMLFDRVRACVRVCVCARECVCVCVCTYACMHARKNTRTQASTRERTHARTYARTHARTHPGLYANYLVSEEKYYVLCVWNMEIDTKKLCMHCLCVHLCKHLSDIVHLSGYFSFSIYLA